MKNKGSPRRRGRNHFGVRGLVHAFGRRLVAVECWKASNSPGPLNAALLWRQVAKAAKAVTSHRTPNLRACAQSSIIVVSLARGAHCPRPPPGFREDGLRFLRQRTMPMNGRLPAACTLFALAALAVAPAENFPQWRGPDGQGHAMASGLPQTWSETENVAWKTSIPGRGWSSPVIEGQQIWLTTALETPAKPEDAQRRLKANTGNQPVTVLEEVRFRAICVDRDSGRIVHDVPVLTEREPQWVHEQNS